MNQRLITKDTQLCISLAARPSNIGTRFHNFLYAALELDYVYKAFAPTDIDLAVAGIRGLGIRGAAVSMPYKQHVITLLDEIDASARAIDAVNTIVNTDGVLIGYNTDYVAIHSLIQGANIASDRSIGVLGSGGMARACVAAIRGAGFQHVTIAARNEESGSAIAHHYEASFCPLTEFGGADVIINATPIGMAGGAEADELPLPSHVIETAQLVWDVVAMPRQTPLIRLASEHGIPTIHGGQVMTLQAVEQFVLYTGIRPSAELIAQASSYSQSN
jgi:shikimate dehydrogenase